MALQESGIELVAKNYADYMAKLKEINKAHKDAFSSSNAKGVRDTGVAAEGAAGGIGSLTSALGGLKAAFGAVLAIGFVKKTLDYANAAGALAQRIETLRVSLDQVAEASGYSTGQVDYAIESLKEQGITTQAAEQSLMRMARAHISWAEAAKLAAIAQGSAVTAGMSSSDAFNRLILGIQKMEPELLDELGITLRRGQAYKQMADQLGKSSDDLTDAERQQAILNSVYEQSSVVLGVYEAAMDTAGKKQSSMTRLMEETQLNIGNMIKPLKDLSINLQYDMWKGAQKASKGLEGFGIALEIIIEEAQGIPGVLQGANSQIENHGGFWSRLGESIWNFSRMTVVIIAQWAAHIEVQLSKVGNTLVNTSNALGQALDDAAHGKFGEALSGMSNAIGDALNAHGDIVDESRKKFEEKMKGYLEKFPDLLKSYDELGKVPETPLDPTGGGETTTNVEEMTKALEKQIDVLRTLEKIQDDYNQSLDRARKSYQANVDKAIADANKKALSLQATLNEKLSNIDEDLADKEADIREDANKRILEQQKRHHQDMMREKAHFELQMMQATRRFQVEDTRLRAEGDVLAVMQLREDFALQQQEAQENRSLEAQEAQQSQVDEVRNIQQDAQERIAEARKEAESRRAEAREDYQDQLEELSLSLAERKEELRVSYEEEFALLQESRTRQIEELGASLRDQGELTEEGMKTIADAMRAVFGEDAEADALIKGWSTRTETLFGGVIEEMMKQIEAVSQGIAAAEAAIPASSGRVRFQPPGARPRPVGMREGGSGIVTGPATFEVEPGVREHVSFTPLPPVSGNITLGGRAAIDLSGLSNQGVSSETEQRIADTLVDELRIAISRMTRRF